MALAAGVAIGARPAGALPIPAATEPTPVTARLLLDKRQVKAGAPVKGRLVLTNPTAATIDLSGDCAPRWEVVLGRGKKAPPVAFSQLCETGSFPVAPGADPYPFRVSTTGLHPGKYHAFLVASDPAFPSAKRVPVTIVATH